MKYGTSFRAVSKPFKHTFVIKYDDYHNINCPFWPFNRTGSVGYVLRDKQHRWTFGMLFDKKIETGSVKPKILYIW